MCRKAGGLVTVPQLKGKAARLTYWSGAMGKIKLRTNKKGRTLTMLLPQDLVAMLCGKTHRYRDKRKSFTRFKWIFGYWTRSRKPSKKLVAEIRKALDDKGFKDVELEHVKNVRHWGMATADILRLRVPQKYLAEREQKILKKQRELYRKRKPLTVKEAKQQILSNHKSLIADIQDKIDSLKRVLKRPKALTELPKHELESASGNLRIALEQLTSAEDYLYDK